MPEPATEPRSRRLPRTVSPAPVAIGATSAVLVLIALADAGGAALMACGAACAAALAVAGVWWRSAPALVLAAALTATVVLGIAGLALGRRASTESSAGHAFPLVVGLPLERAKALFQRHGPVRFVIRRVAYGARGTVLRATGYSPDGTYAPGSTITLVVGTHAPAPKPAR